MSTSNCMVRPATVDDLEAINAIYNHFVLSSVCTYQEVEETMEDRRAWFARHDATRPVTVAERDGIIVGWASLSPFHARSAYRFTVENSVYVDHRYHKQGVGSVLMSDLMARAGNAGLHAVIAGIDSEQTGSLALHAKFGFEKVAHLKQVGFKFGRWLDVVYLQRLL